MTTKKTAKKSKIRKIIKVDPDNRAEETAPVAAHSRSLELDDWLDEIRATSLVAATAGAPKGACLVPNPRTGGNDCIRTDQTTCTKFHGTWIGGPCGPN